MKNDVGPGRKRYFMPPSQRHLLSRRKVSLLLLTIGLVSGGTLACQTTKPRAASSQYGFKAAPEAMNDADVAWLAVADAATRSYKELAMLNFTVRQLGWEVVYTAGNPRIKGMTLYVNPVDCIADSALLPIFAAVASNLLGRDVSEAADKAAEMLRPTCPGYVAPPSEAKPDHQSNSHSPAPVIPGTSI
jgi:hypothetical protein